MAKDPTVAIRDGLAEIAILDEIAARMTLEIFKSDPIVRRADGVERLFKLNQDRAAAQ